MTAAPAQINESLAAEFGLSAEEFQKTITILGRTPNLTELGIFSVMWSEHCSYKSTRLHLGKLPTKAPWVICGPGENAGIIDIGDNDAIIFKMESHNHPSFIEPYQGAATGVGGIMRDVFTMGARPIAMLNALRFGAPNHPKTPHLLAGVVAGIGGYGNCMGIPTIAGSTEFHKSYNTNILVNAMCVGLAPADKIFYSSAENLVGKPIVYVGAKTGRDGIHGATMASAEFDDSTEAKRPTVQVGDPFTEKRVMEACLELMESDAIIAIQDMGAAGLTCSTLEMADKSGTGAHLNLNAVPTREPGMTPYEMMLSESQERMLMIINPEKESHARAVFDKWELDFSIIGQMTDTGRLQLEFDGDIVADMPVKPLSDEAPIYDRPHTPTLKHVAITSSNLPQKDIKESLITLISCPDLASKRWIYEQYDRHVGNDTLSTGGDAGLVRIHGSTKAVAMSADCTPRYCFADPFEGGKQAVAETYRNISATGATPKAITNCLNFGNPERPEIMGQLVGCLEGMSEACTVLDYPIVSGNVSLYNETNGTGIHPTPAIGGVGVIEDASKAVTPSFKASGELLYLVGSAGTQLGASLYLREVEGREEGAPPPVDLQAEKSHGTYVRAAIAQGLLTASHDISDGGLLVAVAEMALAGMAQGGIGAELFCGVDAAVLFGEDQARYVVTVSSSDQAAFEALASEKNAPVSLIGHTQKELLLSIKKDKSSDQAQTIIALDDVRAGYESGLMRCVNGE